MSKYQIEREPVAECARQFRSTQRSAPWQCGRPVPIPAKEERETMKKRETLTLPCEDCSKPSTQHLVGDSIVIAVGLCDEHRKAHRRDEDCTTFVQADEDNPDFVKCVTCEVWSMWPCQGCGAERYHLKGCPTVIAMAIREREEGRR